MYDAKEDASTFALRLDIAPIAMFDWVPCVFVLSAPWSTIQRQPLRILQLCTGLSPRTHVCILCLVLSRPSMFQGKDVKLGTEFIYGMSLPQNDPFMQVNRP